MTAVNEMKRIFITIGIFMVLATYADAGDLYICTNRDGKQIITSSPQDDMGNCELYSSTPNTKAVPKGIIVKRTLLEKRINDLMAEDKALAERQKLKDTPEIRAARTRIGNELSRLFEISAQERATDIKGKAIKKNDEIIRKQKELKARQTRKNNCMNCCKSKMPACYNYTADKRVCRVEEQNCIATCRSEGSSPSSWSDCWSNSESNKL
jgi:hypothetical protein